MWIQMSNTFREEAERFRLVYACEDCAQFCESRETCAIQYPTAPHRAAHIASLENGDRLHFCKMFEAR
jgi:hypothetical protein